MAKTPVTFYSEGVKLVGDLYTPDDLKPGERRAGIALCHGYRGVRNLYLPDTAAELNARGYVALAFDYKGWGDSEGPPTRLAPWGRVADVQAALTFLGIQDCVDKTKLALYGPSYGTATVIWAAAIDPRVKCVVGLVGVGEGRRWMRSVRRPDEYADLLARSEADRERRVLTGQSEFVPGSEILLPDRQSAELTASRNSSPGAVATIPLEFIDETLSFHAEWVVDKIAPRPLLLLAAGDDRLVPPEQMQSLYDKAGEPKRLVVLEGAGHYQIYTGKPFEMATAEALAWYEKHLPAR